MSGQETLLVVEKPTPERRRTLGLTAATAGLDLHVIQDPEVALRWLERNLPRALLLDGSLTNARTLCHRMRSTPRLEKTPILVVAADLQDRLAEQFYGWGADDVVPTEAGSGLPARLIRLAKTEPGQPSVRRGRAVVAIPDLGPAHVIRQVLAAAGYDVALVANERALLSEVVQRPAALVIASAGVGDVRQLVQAARTSGSEAAWLVTCPERDVERHTESMAGVAGVFVTRDSAPAHDLLFLSNRLLSRVVLVVRKAPRVLHATIVRYRARGGSEDDAGLTYTISPGGMYVRTVAPPPSQELWLELGVPLGQRRVRLLGRIVWRRPYGTDEPATVPPGFAVEISDGLGDDISLWQAGAFSLIKGSRQPAAGKAGATREDPPPATQAPTSIESMGFASADHKAPGGPVEQPRATASERAPSSSSGAPAVPDATAKSVWPVSWFAPADPAFGSGPGSSAASSAPTPVLARRRPASPLRPVMAVTVALGVSVGAAIGGWYALEPRDSEESLPEPTDGPVDDAPTVARRKPAQGAPEPSTRVADERPPEATASPEVTASPDSGSPAPSEAAAPDVSQLSAEEGYLWVDFPDGAEVYLNGISRGKVNSWLKVKCRTWYVRVGDGRKPPSWLTPGRTVVIACSDLTRRSFTPGAH